MAGSPDWITVDPQGPDPEAISRASAIIQGGGLVIFPTKGLYGLAADARNPSALDRIFQVKQRSRKKPLLVLINDRSDLSSLTSCVPDIAAALMDRFWPGDVTIVFEALPDLSSVLTAGTGKIGVRMPQHPVAQALVHSVGSPVTGTSANISGAAGCADPQRLAPDLIQRVDLVLDAGILPGGPGSTVVDVTVSPVRILRQGRVSQEDILAAVA